MVINVHVVDSGQGGASNSNDEIWRPRRITAQTESLSENEQRAEEFFRTVRGLLNKLTPANFCKIIEKLKLLVADDMMKLDGIVSMVLEKAVREPKYTRWYLEMLCSLSDMFECDRVPETHQYRCDSLFAQKLLLLFETLRTTRIDSQMQSEIDACPDPAKRLLLEEQHAETTFKMRTTFRGTGLVIGEAYVLQIITTKTIMYCTETLLASEEENPLECLNALLTVTGKTLEYHLDPSDMERYFDAIKVLSEKSTLPTRIRFMLANLLDRRINSWIPRYAVKDLQAIDEVFRSLSNTYEKPNQSTATSSDSAYLIDAKEAQRINNIFNKFTQCRRNLTEVIYCFQEITTEEKSKIIEVFITCVAKGDIYSEDCGKLFAVLLHTKIIVVQNIVDGIMAVIKNFYENVIFTDQQIWIHVKEIFIPLFTENVLHLSDIDLDEIKKLVKVKPKTKLAKKNKKSAKPELLWRRGVPVTAVRKTKSELDAESDQKEEEKEEEKEQPQEA